mmetsp:Transcript_7316/g.14586  ORF Transcript_7316/g.14586 Transcript_7316/m.14586 type:complete len:407 (+) Transcript_7316:1748-2968(+)
MPSLRRLGSIGLFSFLLSTYSGFLATAESSTPIWLGRINLGVFKNCSDAYAAFEGAIKALGEEAEEEEQEQEGKSLSVLRELKSSSSCFIKFSAFEDQVEELQNRLDWLTEIEADIEVGHTGAPYAWGLDRVDQTSLPLDRRPYEPLYDGSGITIYVLDTGVYTEHQEFDGGERASLGINLVSDESADNLNGHGTHVASLAVGTHVGTAPGAQVVAVKVLNKSGKGSISRVIEGMHWVLNELEEKQKNETNGRGTGAIMSMSLGGSRSTFFNSVVKEAVEAGVGVVVAANNDAQDACKSSPASAEEAITVGATKKGDSMAGYSNYGSCVDLYAPGSSIEGALHGSRTSYLVMSGTSMATPAVSGALAGRLQKHSWDLAKATKDLLLYTSHNQVTNTRGTLRRNCFV